MTEDKRPSIASAPSDEPAWTPQIEEFKQHRERVWEDRQASSDAFDKALLTFSSGALGLSLAFIKDIVPLERAVYLVFLFVSWACFSACIVVTVLSFRFSIAAMDKQLVFLEKYYLEGDELFLNRKNVWSGLVTICAMIGAALFLAGLIATVIFVYSNTVRMGSK
jgi:hypothetical protein